MVKSLPETLEAWVQSLEAWVQSLGQGFSPGEGNGNPLRYSCLENFMDGRAWWTAVHEVAIKLY